MEANNPADPKSNDVDNIRNILFGEQIRQVTNQFDQVERSINSLRTENQNLRQALEMEVSKREQEIKKLEALLQAKTQELDALINSQIDTLGSIFKKHQKEMSAIENEMISQFEKAILEYRKKSTK